MPDKDPPQLISNLLPELRSGEFPRDRIDEMCDLILSEDEMTAASCSGGFFSNLIEPLCDSFSPRDVSIYNRLFVRVIESSRRRESGATLNKALESCGLQTEKQLVERATRLTNSVERDRYKDRASRLKRVILLSRVTLGADIAITSVIVERFFQMLPEAEIVLVGPQKLGELFGGESRIGFEAIEYGRSGPVRDRLLAWVDLRDRLRDLNKDLPDDGYVVIDPDSRLTQLGLLPVTNDSNYLFFPSRSYKSDSDKPLARLTADWLDEITGESTGALPSLRLSPADEERGRRIVGAMRKGGAAPIAAVNFGVGENESKRLGKDFESKLLSGLLDKGVRVVLDKGGSAGEIERADAALLTARTMSPCPDSSVVELVESNLGDYMESLRTSRIVTWTGRIGLLSGFIGESDLYIGYDSAGQHIAAALGVHCIDLFAGAGARFRQRWSPTGRAECVVIPAMQSDPQSALSQVLASARHLLIM